MKLSVTERGTWRRCRRQWYYSNNLRLQPLVSKPALELGGMVHSALAGWLVAPNDDLESIYIGIAEQRLEAVTTRDVSTEDVSNFLTIIEQGKRLIRGYQKEYKTPLPDNIKLVQPEQEAHIAFGSHILKVKLDAIVADNLDTIYVLEHKTYSRKPTQEALDMNDQFLAYLWGANELGLGKVGGVLYDGISKAKVPEYYRTILYRSTYELLEFGQTLAAEAEDIERATSYFPNRRWEGCWDCGFVKLCVSESRGEDFDYIRNAFYTVRPPTATDLLTESE